MMTKLVLSEENKICTAAWRKNHRRYYNIAGLTIQVDSDLPIGSTTFHPKFKLFETDEAGEDIVRIEHHFSLPDLNLRERGEEAYRKSSWVIYKMSDCWMYVFMPSMSGERIMYHIIFFNPEKMRADIYHIDNEKFLRGNLTSITLLPTDQVFLAPILANKDGFYIHSCGVDLAGRGLLFVGHSEAGKSTIATLLKNKARILCDDRVIVKKDGDFKIYGTWNNGDVEDISPESAPLRAVLFLEKAKTNYIIPLKDKREIIKRLLDHVIKPFMAAEWWRKTLMLMERLTEEVPFYVLQFDKSDNVVDLLKQL